MGVEYITQDPRNFWQIRFLYQYMYGHSGFIAGGVFKNLFNGERVKDVDVFFESAEDYVRGVKVFDEKVSKEKDRWAKAYSTDKVKAYRDKKHNVIVELIKKSYGDVEDTLDAFDFTIAKFAVNTTWDPEIPEDEGQYTTLVHYHPDFFEHLHLKRLVADEDSITMPISTFHRMIRYIGYGYKPCHDTRKEIIKALHSLPSQAMDNINAGSFYDGID